MCVIIVRNPGVDIPQEKIESACVVNSDGVGMSVVDRGKIETIKHYNPKGTDPEYVAKLLDDARDQKVYLHLRFATQGQRSEENCHPFVAYSDDELDVMLMHNGTFSDFSGGGTTAKMTDTEQFAIQVVDPLIERTLAFTEDPLNDDFVQLILKKYAGTGNRLVLFDSLGRDFIHGVGESKWHDDNSWWSSNVYSFNRTHREPSRNSTKGYSWPDSTKASGQCDVPFTGGTTRSHAPVSGQASSRTTGAATASKTHGSTSTFPKRSPVDPQRAVSFVELAGLHTLEEVCEFDEETLRELVTDQEIAFTLLRDLIHELYHPYQTT